MDLSSSFTPPYFIRPKNPPLPVPSLLPHPRLSSHTRFFRIHPKAPSLAESHLVDLFNSSTPCITHTPPHLFASDASMSPSRRSLHTSVVVLNRSLSVSLTDFLPFASIQHAEAFGVLISSLLVLDARDSLDSAPIVYTDHLSSVNLASGMPPLPHQLSYNPARSLYRWCFSILTRFDPSSAPSIQHVKAHTDTNSLPCNLNRLADNIVSHSHTLLLPAAPLSSFTMDNFATFDNTPYTAGFSKTSLYETIDLHLSIFTCNSLPYVIAPPFADMTPPPEYPYTTMRSAFSAVVQLYARSRQLPTNLTISGRLPPSQPWCSKPFEKLRSMTLHRPRIQSYKAPEREGRGGGHVAVEDAVEEEGRRAQAAKCKAEEEAAEARKQREAERAAAAEAACLRLLCEEEAEARSHACQAEKAAPTGRLHTLRVVRFSWPRKRLDIKFVIHKRGGARAMGHSLLTLTLEELLKADLLALAVTCKEISKLALSLLWQSNPIHFGYLLKLLPLEIIHSARKQA
ncbi:hypothetical protein H0H92_014590 [Tricholoma furcatifolium]|nr:hypothetical protein H0H92_014590 [Tricholoma furcatifolium]